MNRLFICLSCVLTWGSLLRGEEYNQIIVDTIHAKMPKGGTYAKYQKAKPGHQFDDLYQTVEDLGKAVDSGLAGKLRVNPEKAARYSFCSSATYLLFTEVLEELQKKGGLEIASPVVTELSDVGDKKNVIMGKMDGIGIFGHWNADGPGTAVLFEKLDLGTNFSSFEKAKPGDFLKIFWNENIGKGERGHLVVYLGTSPDGSAIQVWSSNTTNTDRSSGYGTMWVEKSRIKRALFLQVGASRKPEPLAVPSGEPEEQRLPDPDSKDWLEWCGNEEGDRGD